MTPEGNCWKDCFSTKIFHTPRTFIRYSVDLKIGIEIWPLVPLNNALPFIVANSAHLSKSRVQNFKILLNLNNIFAVPTLQLPTSFCMACVWSYFMTTLFLEKTSIPPSTEGEKMSSNKTLLLLPRFNSSNLWQVSPELLNQAWAWSAAQFFIAILGIGLNSIVIYAIAQFETLRRGVNVQILSLAIASLIYDAVIKIPAAIGLILQWYTPIPHALQWRVYMMPLQTWLISTVSYHITAISINRFLAVVCPQVYRKLKTRKVTTLYLMPCWVLPGFVAAVSYSGVLGSYAPAPPFGYVLPAPEARGLSLLIQCTMVYGPTIVMATCYSGIFMQFLMIRATVAPVANARVLLAPTGRTRTLQRRIRASQTIFLCFVLFCVNYYPATLAYVIAPTSPQRYPLLFLWFRLLAHSATLVNPVSVACTGAEKPLLIINNLKHCMCVKSNFNAN